MSDEEDSQMEVEAENSSSSSEDEETQLTARAEELERDISANRYLYDAHVEIVDLYRKLGDLNSMREAYQRFSKCFPLTPKLWLDWIRDEIKLANSPNERQQVFHLFDQAVEDYLSVDLWMEYSKFALDTSPVETARSILERGVVAAGLHAAKARALWDLLRKLEQTHLEQTTPGSEEWTTQVNRLFNVFKRQLSVPLMDMEDTYCQWTEWYSSLPEGAYEKEPVEWGYRNAKKTWEVYKPFETRIMTEGNGTYELYKEYIDVVKDPSTKICLFERAMHESCLIPDVWIDYCLFIFKLGEAANSVSRRALRNCPWSEELWIMRLRLLEHQSIAENDILRCFEEGIASISPNPGLELWISYLEYLHRNNKDVKKLDRTFDQAIMQLSEVDISCKVSRFFARILAKRGDMKESRSIWKHILSKQNNKELASVWLEYASLERQYGDGHHVRGVFKRSLEACTSWCQSLADEWLMYEREFGTLEELMKCIEICKKNIKLEVQNTQEIVDQPHETEPSKKRKFDREKVISHKKGKFEKFTPTVDEKPQTVQKHIDKDPKTTVFVSNLHYSVTEKTLKNLFPNAKAIEIVLDRRGKSKCFGYMQFSKEEETLTALARDRVPIDGRPVFISEIKPDKLERKPIFKYSTGVEKNKLFVRGLPTTKTKEDIENLFKPHSSVDVRLIVTRKGESKGIAYVEFADEEAAQRALKATDQMRVDDNVITVAVSAPPPIKEKKPYTDRINEPIRHSRSNLQLSLIPRSVQVKTSGKESEDSNGQQRSKNTPKTNADFRNMLLKK